MYNKKINNFSISLLNSSNKAPVILGSKITFTATGIPGQYDYSYISLNPPWSIFFPNRNGLYDILLINRNKFLVFCVSFIFFNLFNSECNLFDLIFSNSNYSWTPFSFKLSLLSWIL